MVAVRRVLTGILIGVAATAGPARADVIAQSAQGFVSRNVVLVAATPAAVWKRLVSPGTWWSSDHTFSGDAANMSLDPVPGGCFCERLPGDLIKGPKGTTRGPLRGGVEHMRVVYAERGKALRMTGALGPLQSEAVTGTLTITLKDMDGGTRIIFEYVVGGYMRYPADKIQPAVDTVMSNQLLSLAHGFSPVAGEQREAAPTAPDPGGATEPGAAPTGKGLDKQGMLLPRGRIWSLPPSDGAPPPSTPAPTEQPPAASAAPLEAAAVPPDVAPSGGVPAKAKRGKAKGKAPATPESAPKSDEPSTDAVNSVFDSALGDPQRPVQTAPN